MTLVVKFIGSRKKNHKGKLIRNNQNFKKLYTFPTEYYSTEEEAYRFFKDRFTNFIGLKVKKY